MSSLNWPPECARVAKAEPAWRQTGSNVCLDFHGDSRRARLVVFSDGNHHMALEECLQHFLAAHPAVEDVFYVTTPPAVLLTWLEAGSLHVGNLRLSLRPHIFISPPKILDRVVATRHASHHVPFMRSRGNVLLVRKGNPKAIHTLADLARPGVRLFLSNPKTETASYEVYVESLKGLARAQGVASDFLDAGAERIVYGERIHHREAPQVLVDDRADAALLYYHLALRYTRIFPEYFEMVPLDGTPTVPATENIISEFHLALVGDGGEWGAVARDYLLGEEATEIYARHGLRRAA
ncbi:MAG: substrate-binding domain-containing protein [Gammaproteobacteria bacterium]|nr:substrate-binding domain-containing protein [Gammaproteobacteria bacterium]